MALDPCHRWLPAASATQSKLSGKTITSSVSSVCATLSYCLLAEAAVRTTGVSHITVTDVPSSSIVNYMLFFQRNVA